VAATPLAHGALPIFLWARAILARTARLGRVSPSYVWPAPFAPAAILTHYRWDRESRPSISRHRQRHARATRYFDFHTFIANDTITRQSELALCPDSRIKVITTFAFYIYKAAAL
jgi:hypothetical protein